MTHDHLAALREAAIRLLNELDKHGYHRNCDAAVAHMRGILIRQTGGTNDRSTTNAIRRSPLPG